VKKHERNRKQMKKQAVYIPSLSNWYHRQKYSRCKFENWSSDEKLGWIEVLRTPPPPPTNAYKLISVT
jgi:hypothetical protein